MALIVFLHGVGDTPQSWQDQVAALPPRATAAAPWLRGTRPGKPETFTVAAAADDIWPLLNQHGVEQLQAVGSSLGAVVALELATRMPDTVSHLVLAAGQVHPPATAMRVQRIIGAMIPRRRLARIGIEKHRFLAALDAAAAIDYRRELHKVTARTLVLVGAQDRANRPAAEQLAAGISGATLEVVTGAGHTIHTDAPDRFNDLVFSFLAQN
ncbi:MAG: alpha/beta fold hydrolase [Propioniciclava sp.]